MSSLPTPTFASFLSLFPDSDHDEIRRFARIELYMADVSDEYLLAPLELASLGLERWFKAELSTMPITHVYDVIRRLESPLKTHFEAVEAAASADVVHGFTVIVADREFVAWTGMDTKDYYLPAKGVFDSPEGPPVSTLAIFVDMLLHRILQGCAIASANKNHEDLVNATLNPESEYSESSG